MAIIERKKKGKENGYKKDCRYFGVFWTKLKGLEIRSEDGG